jgi:hypothetical protein
MRHFSLIALLVVLLVTAPIGATATETPTDDVQVNATSDAPSTTSTPTATETASPKPTATPVAAPASTPNATETERIDSDTVLVASEWNETTGAARITIRSETSQAVTLSDAGRFVQGGKVPTTTVALRGGTTSTIEISVTEVDGRVGVAISTDKTPLYSEIIQSDSGGGLGILEAVSTLQAWLGGATIAFVWMCIAGWSVMRREGGHPEVAT